MEGAQKQLSLNGKLEILSQSHNGEANTSISESVGCTNDTFSQILSNVVGLLNVPHQVSLADI